MTTSQNLTFLFIIFIVGFLADIVLNDLSQSKLIQNQIILSLKPYFKKNGILISGIFAGLTVMIASILLLIFTTLPKTFYQLFIFSFPAFILGYILDILIDKSNLFGDELKPFYQKAGSGFWGAVSFLVAIWVSFTLQK